MLILAHTTINTPKLNKIDSARSSLEKKLRHYFSHNFQMHLTVCHITEAECGAVSAFSQRLKIVKCVQTIYSRVILTCMSYTINQC